MAQEQLRDGASILSTYTFTVNHSEEDADDRKIAITRTALTTGVGYVRQQGTPSPRILRYQGTILTQAQYDAMLGYYEACAGIGTGGPRTVFFKDADTTEYEVLITDFSPKRVRVSRNSREPSLLWVWKYTLEMEVIA